MNESAELRMFPSTLRSELDTESVIRQPGTLTTSIYGSHIHVTVRLRRWWPLVVKWATSEDQLRRWEDYILRAGLLAYDALVLIVMLGVMYLMISIGAGFLPGGAVERVLGGGQ
jgi:hypothetical protein